MSHAASQESYHILNDLTDPVAGPVIEYVHAEGILITLFLLDSPLCCQLVSSLSHDPLVVSCVPIRRFPAHASVLVLTRIFFGIANVDPALFVFPRGALAEVDVCSLEAGAIFLEDWCKTSD